MGKKGCGPRLYRANFSCRQSSGCSDWWCHGRQRDDRPVLKPQRASAQVQLTARGLQEIQSQYARVLHACHPHWVADSFPPHSQCHFAPAFHGCQPARDCAQLHSGGLYLSLAWHHIRSHQCHCGPRVHKSSAGNPLYGHWDVTKVPNTSPPYHYHRLRGHVVVCFWGEWALTPPSVLSGLSCRRRKGRGWGWGPHSLPYADPGSFPGPLGAFGHCLRK